MGTAGVSVYLTFGLCFCSWAPLWLSVRVCEQLLVCQCISLPRQPAIGLTTVTLAFKRQRQEGCRKCEARLDYIMSSRVSGATRVRERTFREMGIESHA